MKLQEYWEQEKLPEENAIYFSNGKMLVIKENWCSKSFSYDTSMISILEKEFGTEGAEIVILDQLENTKTNTIAYRGAGCMGNEGFISLADINGQLIWAIFSSFSNPFWNIEFSNEHIIATTELEFKWIIPINNPEKMTCEAKNPWDIELIKEREKTKLS